MDHGQIAAHASTEYSSRCSANRRTAAVVIGHHCSSEAMEVHALQRYALETSPRVFTLSERLAHPLALVGIEHPEADENANGERIEHDS